MNLFSMYEVALSIDKIGGFRQTIITVHSVINWYTGRKKKVKYIFCAYVFFSLSANY